MSAAAEAAAPSKPALVWVKRDNYHAMTECGRYSVSRVTVTPYGYVVFIAWRLKPRREIGSMKIAIGASDDERREARRAMQAIGEADASATP